MTASSPIGSDRRAAAVPVRNSLKALWYRSRVYQLTLRGRVPTQVRLALPYSWPEDRPRAEAMMNDAFLFAGQRYSFGEAGWSAGASQTSVAAALHGFSWLTDLRAVGTKAAHATAVRLVDDWITAHARWSTLAWRPDVIGRRLAAWLTSADFLLHNCDDAFRGRLLTALAAQARHLWRVGAPSTSLTATSAGLKGELAAALCLGIGKTDAVIGHLNQWIDDRIVGSGGLSTRSPSVALAVLKDLLDIRAALQVGGRRVPRRLSTAVDRLAAALRTLRLGDGTLAVFHGGKEEDARLVDAVLARAAAARSGAASADGYQRLAAGRIVLIVDGGSPPVDDPNAHAGILAFEMSVGGERLIVNCGSYAGDDPAWRRALSAPDAHSTLIVGDEQPTTVTEGARRPRVPMRVMATRREGKGAVWLDVACDGDRRAPGTALRRRLYVNAIGDEVRGEDVVTVPADERFRIRFHLHPLVKASRAQDGSAVWLRTRSGDGWRFEAAAEDIALCDSIYLGASDVPRRSSQIVISGVSRGGDTAVCWSFRRELR